VEELLPGTGSVTADDTVAVFVIVVPELPEVVWTTRVMLADPPLAIVPRGHETVVVPLHVP
jgi:hypothetical protein